MLSIFEWLLKTDFTVVKYCQKKVRNSHTYVYARDEMEDKVRKRAKIRKGYNQVPHLTQVTTWKSNKNTINITNKSQEVSPFPAGDHKAARNRYESMRNTRHINTNDPQKKYCLGTVSKNILDII